MDSIPDYKSEQCGRNRKMITENAKKTIKAALKPFYENGIIAADDWKELQTKLTENPQTPKRPDLLTRQDLLKIFNVSKRTLINWEKAGSLKPVKMPGKRLVRYKAEDIEEIANGSL